MENISNMSSEEELMQLRNDGKVSEAEYQDLLAAIRKSPAKDTKEVMNAVPFISLKDIPWQIWVVIALLALEGVGNFLYIPQQPLALYWLGVKCLLIFGLLKRWRWVFCLFVIIGIMHFLSFILHAPLAAMINLAMVVLALSTYRFYFRSQAEYDKLYSILEKLFVCGSDIPPYQSDIQDSKQKQGKIAIYLMSAGFVMPILCFIISFIISEHFYLGEMDVVVAVCLALCAFLEVPAFVFGVISWPDVLGKATVTTISVLTVILMLVLSLIGSGTL
jgi:hypothetical protein